MPAVCVVVTGVEPRLCKTSVRRRMGGERGGYIYPCTSKHRPVSSLHNMRCLCMKTSLFAFNKRDIKPGNWGWHRDLLSMSAEKCEQCFFLVRLDGDCKHFQFKNTDMEYTLTINSVSDLSKISLKERD